MNLLVVIVSYRATDLTIDCLRSLSEQIHTVPDAKVAVCENGTGKNSARKLAEAIERECWGNWVMLKVISPNRGFAGGNNVVLREAMTWDPPPKYFLLLNADTIVRPGALAALLDAMERRPDVGIVGARLEFADGAPQSSCYRDPSPLSEFLRAAGTGRLNRLFREYEVTIREIDAQSEPDWICFACAMIRREVVDQIGVLDAGYYLYFDDPDYCRRAGAAGWRITYCPEALVTHLEGRSNPVESLAAARRRRPRYYYASRARYFAKFYGRSGLWLANLMWLAGRMISLGRELAGNKAPHLCDKEWLDIWTNGWRPVVRRNLALSTEGRGTSEGADGQQPPTDRAGPGTDSGLSSPRVLIE